MLSVDSVGADLGCGSGRWALSVAPRVGTLHCIDASAAALEVARLNLSDRPNCTFECASIEESRLAPLSLDFAYSLGVLHHTPNPFAALRACARYLKPGAPFLLYLYYRFDNRPLWFRVTWALSDALRKGISRCPYRVRYILSQIIAVAIYWPLARLAWLLKRVNRDVSGVPLSYYADKSFYVLRTDALDRFGTRLEHRFTRSEMTQMLEQSGFRDIRFRDSAPDPACARPQGVSSPVTPSGTSTPSLDPPRRRLLFVCNVGWFFISHRLSLAVAASRAGIRCARGV